MELSSVSFCPHLHEPKTQQKKGKIGKEVSKFFYFIIKASLTAPFQGLITMIEQTDTP